MLELLRTQNCRLSPVWGGEPERVWTKLGLGHGVGHGLPFGLTYVPSYGLAVVNVVKTRRSML